MSPLDEHRIGLLFRNLVILDFVALPVAVLALTLNEFLLTGSAQWSSLYDLGLPYLVAILPLSFGGVIHQIMTLNLPRSWSFRKRRLVSLAMSPVVVCVFLLMLELGYFLRLALPVTIGLAVYNALLRLPADGDGR